MSNYREPSLPDGFVPFAIDDTVAATAVARTLSTEYSVPATFRETAKLIGLEAVWVPAWLLHARITGSWEGERGDERGGLEGAPTADWDYNWSSQRGTLDEPLVLLEVAAVAYIGAIDESMTSSLREEPSRDAARIEPTVSREQAIASLEERGGVAARRFARERLGGDSERNLTTSVRTEFVSARRVWLPYFRGTYGWKQETHGVWVSGRSADTVRLESKPSDAVEVAAREALNAANKQANERQMNRIVLIAIAPVAFIVLYYVVATLIRSLFR